MASVEGWLDAARAMNAKYEAPTESDAEWADAIIFDLHPVWRSGLRTQGVYRQLGRTVVPGQA